MDSSVIYGLPEDFDPSVFVGRELENVSFSANTVYLGFGDRLSLTVLSSLQHQVPSESNPGNPQSVPLAELKLMRLPGRSVVGAKLDEDGTLILLFESGDVLRVLNDEPYYESYWVQCGDKQFIVQGHLG